MDANREIIINDKILLKLAKSLVQQVVALADYKQSSFYSKDKYNRFSVAAMNYALYRYKPDLLNYLSDEPNRFGFSEFDRNDGLDKEFHISCLMLCCLCQGQLAFKELSSFFSPCWSVYEYNWDEVNISFDELTPLLSKQLRAAVKRVGRHVVEAVRSKLAIKEANSIAAHLANPVRTRKEDIADSFAPAFALAALSRSGYYERRAANRKAASIEKRDDAQFQSTVPIVLSNKQNSEDDAYEHEFFED